MTARGLVDASTFRDALSRWSSGVAVLTAADGAGGTAATTVSSFTSVSLDPPLVLVALSTKSRTLRRIEATARFAVSVLSAHQRDVAEQCARLDAVDQALFDEAGHVRGALAMLACGVHDIRAYGDHLVVVGEVSMARRNEHDAPLLYWNRDYRALHLGVDQTST
jgi:flavin reductase (NADH)